MVITELRINNLLVYTVDSTFTNNLCNFWCKDEGFCACGSIYFDNNVFDMITRAKTDKISSNALFTVTTIYDNGQIYCDSI